MGADLQHIRLKMPGSKSAAGDARLQYTTSGSTCPANFAEQATVLHGDKSGGQWANASELPFGMGSSSFDISTPTPYP